MPNWSDLSRPLPSWFNDTPFGIFLHWGAYSVPGWAEPIGELGTVEGQEWMSHNPYAEWYANTMRIEGSPAAQHHAETWGGCSYDDFLHQWTCENFDPSAWIDLFQRAGAGYLVPTTKHHDGIALWEAPHTGDRNTVRRGPHRDLVDELATAARARGMRFGSYFSGGFDWHVNPASPLLGSPELDRPVGEANARREHADVAFDQCLDLVERYRPDILWNDITWPEAGRGDAERDLFPLLARYRELVPEGLVNDRWGVDGLWDYRTSEYQAGLENETGGAWENCRGIGLSFGWNRNEGPEHYLDGPGLARHLVDVVSRGGHFLLNLGPRADGTLDPQQVASMEALAAWMQVAGGFVVLPQAGSAVLGTPELDGLPTGAWLRRIGQRDGGEAWVVDGCDEVVLPITGAVAVHGCTVDPTDGGMRVRLTSDRLGPAVVTA